MSGDKQIEEMAKHCHFYEEGKCLLLEDEAEECDTKCDMCEFAKRLYNAGYRKSADVAEEIFAEIEEIRLRHIKKFEFFRNSSIEEMERKYYEGAEWGLRQLTYFLAELKKKYTEGGECKSK